MLGMKAPVTAQDQVTSIVFIGYKGTIVFIGYKGTIVFIGYKGTIVFIGYKRTIVFIGTKGPATAQDQVTSERGRI
jgi:hypothetical protein